MTSEELNFLIQAAEQYYRKGMYRSTRKIYEILLENEPQSLDILNRLASLYDSAGYLKEYYELTLRQLEISPKKENILEDLILNLNAMVMAEESFFSSYAPGSYKQIFSSYSEFHKELSLHREEYLKLVSEKELTKNYQISDRILFLASLLNNYYHAGEYEKYLTKLEEFNPFIESLISHPSKYPGYIIYRDCAKVLMALGREEEALSYINKLVEPSSHNIDNFMLRIEILNSLGRKEEVHNSLNDKIQAVEAKIKDKPHSTDNYILKLNLLKLKGDDQLYKALYEEIIKLFPHFLAYLRQEIKAFSDQKEDSQAEKDTWRLRNYASFHESFSFVTKFPFGMKRKKEEMNQLLSKLEDMDINFSRRQYPIALIYKDKKIAHQAGQILDKIESLYAKIKKQGAKAFKINTHPLPYFASQMLYPAQWNDITKADPEKVYNVHLGDMAEVDNSTMLKKQLNHLKRMSHIRSLTLFGNGLNNEDFFSVNLAHQQELRYLDLAENSLTLIPDCLVDCPKLMYLNVSQNRISSLEGLEPVMKHLKVLNLKGNPIPSKLVASLKAKYPRCIIEH
ncbi:hypothetical protein [Spirochaeta cellobiosiphila]|uniref:hypothetical protein n=1 Tax=Spirochaeta cellobiosiphila TaxID=504483 RepID=UPI0003F8175A|nr:hypothetical protein [Spirochaeta cellobiosiphila]